MYGNLATRQHCRPAMILVRVRDHFQSGLGKLLGGAAKGERCA
jgi:hypothetical protein